MNHLFQAIEEECAGVGKTAAIGRTQRSEKK
jgi:hypothetical protein